MLAARGDGGRNLVRFGGAEDEDRPLGRLFEGLQQRVEGFVGDLVRFVDDEDLVAVARRPVADVLAQLAHFVDAAIGGRVDFDDVRRVAGGDFQAAGAHAAGLGGGSLDAVQAARENARDGGLAGAALSGEDVAVRDAAAASIAFSSVVLTCSWLISSAKVCGRYFLAMTWYMEECETGMLMPDPG